MLVVAATDIAAVEAQLRPQLPDRLCIVASRWTRWQLDAAHEHLRARWEQWGIYGTGPSCDEHAQATMTAKLVRVTDEIASWADGRPAGLVTLDPCLTPAAAHEPGGIEQRPEVLHAALEMVEAERATVGQRDGGQVLGGGAAQQRGHGPGVWPSPPRRVDGIHRSTDA